MFFFLSLLAPIFLGPCYSDNLIEGSLPSTITKLRNLRDLRLGDNFLISSLLSDLGRMTDLEILTVNVSWKKLLLLLWLACFLPLFHNGFCK